MTIVYVTRTKGALMQRVWQEQVNAACVEEVACLLSYLVAVFVNVTRGHLSAATGQHRTMMTHGLISRTDENITAAAQWVERELGWR